MCVIRPAQTADAAGIAAVYVETWRTTYAGLLPDDVLINMSRKRVAVSWQRTLKDRREIILIAEDRRAGVIGFASAGTNRDRASRYRGEVYTLYIHPDFQNRGVGARLLADIFRALADAGFNAAVIWVLDLNPSRFFYEAMGGQRVGDRDQSHWGAVLKELAYGWDDLKSALGSGKPELG